MVEIDGRRHAVAHLEIGGTVEEIAGFGAVRVVGRRMQAKGAAQFAVVNAAGLNGAKRHQTGAGHD